jgi:manganese/zinc/iron transport system permease protein
MNLLAQPDVVIISIGALVGIASSLLGTFLVLRKNSMLSDAISHSVLLGIVLAFLIVQNQYSPFLIVGAAAAGVLTVFLTELITESHRLKNDAAIGLVYPLLFAIAVVLINVFARNVHIDIDAVLLGEIGFAWLSTSTLFGLTIATSLLSVLVVTLINLGFVILFYKELKLSTFDSGLAAALGFRPRLIFYALLTLTSITAVTAFDAVGAILLVAFIIVPPSAAYLLTDKLWRMLTYGALISLASSVLGYLSALALDVSIGGMMATFTGVFLVIAFLFSPRYGLIAQELRRQQQQLANRGRMLVVHLYNHERKQRREEENVLSALRDHLRWSAQEVDSTMQYSLDNKLVAYTPDDSLLLTAKGRVMAQEVLEPWRQY